MCTLDGSKNQENRILHAVGNRMFKHTNLEGGKNDDDFEWVKNA
jgi:hypothetical protein